MTLTEAKFIADKPAAYTVKQLRWALERLEATKKNGGVRNSQRALDRLSRRLGRLNGELAQRAA